MGSWLGSATLIVTVTWWVGIFVWALISEKLPAEIFAATWRTAAFSTSGLICGAIGTIAWVALDRHERRAALRGTNVRGLTSSIGDVPFLLPPPKAAADLPDLNCPDVEADFYVNWLQEHETASPLHAALVHKLLRILAAHKHLPASPSGDRHGGRTLLQHSLLCGALMHEMAQRFEYDGTVVRAGGRIKLGLRDGSYTFDANDPLCLVIGLCHDFGKIEAFQFDENGNVVGIGREHDSMGARILARLDECWALPDADRFAMMMAIAHYHHPVELPLAPDRQPIDDRTIALMELLISADTMASAIEHDGRRLSKDEIEQRLTASGAVEAVERSADYFDHFWSELNNPNSFNLTSNEGGRNLGWFCDVVGSNRKLILVNEGNMLAAVARRADADPKLNLGDGRSPITIEILKRLQSRDELVTAMKVAGSGDLVQMPAESALWHIQFSKKTATGFVRHFGPVVCYVVEPSKFPDLTKRMVATTSRAEVVAPVMGMGRAIRPKKATGASGSRGPKPADDPGASASAPARQEQPQTGQPSTKPAAEIEPREIGADAAIRPTTAPSWPGMLTMPAQPGAVHAPSVPPAPAEDGARGDNASDTGALHLSSRDDAQVVAGRADVRADPEASAHSAPASGQDEVALAQGAAVLSGAIIDDVEDAPAEAAAATPLLDETALHPADPTAHIALAAPGVAEADERAPEPAHAAVMPPAVEERPTVVLRTTGSAAGAAQGGTALDAGYFEKWAIAAVSRMGDDAVTRFAFSGDIATITLSQQDLERFATEVDWRLSRFALLMHQQANRFRDIKVLPGAVTFDIEVTVRLGSANAGG